MNIENPVVKGLLTGCAILSVYTAERLNARQVYRLLMYMLMYEQLASMPLFLRAAPNGLNFAVQLVCVFFDDIRPLMGHESQDSH